METAIIHDLIPFIDKTYNVGQQGRPHHRRHSMVVIGAARFAVKYPQMFSAALMMSPAVWRNSQGNACSSLHLFNNFDQATWDAEHPVAFLASYTVASSPVSSMPSMALRTRWCPRLMWKHLSKN